MNRIEAHLWNLSVKGLLFQTNDKMEQSWVPLVRTLQRMV